MRESAPPPGERVNLNIIEARVRQKAPQRVAGGSPVVVWLLVQRTDERHGDEQLATRPDHPRELGQDSGRLCDVLEHLCAEDEVEVAQLGGQAVQIGDDVRLRAARVHAFRPVLRDVRAMRKERAIRCIPGSRVEDTAPGRQAPRGSRDLVADRAPVDRRLRDEVAQLSGLRLARHRTDRSRSARLDTVTSPLRIALLGGIPPSLGGGGLEVQMDRTAAALSARGHVVFHVARESSARDFDVLHAFSAEPDVWHALQHWRRSRAPLVLSPVTVTGSRAGERLLRIGARVPVQSLAQRMRAEVVRKADVVVVLTEHEAALMRALGAGRIEVVSNGADIEAPGKETALPSLPEDFVLLLGTVNRRKRQAAAVAALGATAVVAGGFEGTPQERKRFEATIADAGARWLGEVDPVTAHVLLRRARVLAQMSSAETQPLAMLEALAHGTPVVATPLPATRELAARHPGWVRIVGGPSELPAALETLATPPGPPPAIPSWADIAVNLDEIYRSVRTRS